MPNNCDLRNELLGENTLYGISSLRNRKGDGFIGKEYYIKHWTTHGLELSEVNTLTTQEDSTCNVTHFMLTLTLNVLFFYTHTEGTTNCFKCDDGTMCIDQALVCNGMPNCNDDSDETNSVCNAGRYCYCCINMLTIAVSISTCWYHACHRRICQYAWYSKEINRSVKIIQ